MGKLIACTVFQRGATSLSASIASAIQEDWIKFIDPATTKQKQAVPSASQGINTAVYINFEENNSGENTVWLVNESVSTFVTNS